MASRAVSGSCLCGAVLFEVELPTSFCAHCHCSLCRRSHGSGVVTWFGVERGRFRFLGGEDALVRYRSSEHGTRSFCGTCGSTLLCESTRRPGEVDVVLANMHGKIDRPPELHVYFDDRAEWVHVADGLPRLGGKTGMEPLE